MSVLYVTEQQAILRKTSDRIVIEKDDVVLMEVPCLKLETVLLFGNVQVTTQALAELLALFFSLGASSWRCSRETASCAASSRHRRRRTS